MLPLLIIVFIGVFEYTRALRVKQAVSVLVREAGKQALRECSTKRENNEITACLNRVRSDIEALAPRTAAQQVELVLSVYFRPLGAPAAETERLAIAPGETSTPSGHETSFSVARFFTPELQPLIVANERVAVAEIYHNYQAIFQRFLGFYDFRGFVVYEAAIL